MKKRILLNLDLDKTDHLAFYQDLKAYKEMRGASFSSILLYLAKIGMGMVRNGELKTPAAGIISADTTYTYGRDISKKPKKKGKSKSGR